MTRKNTGDPLKDRVLAAVPGTLTPKEMEQRRDQISRQVEHRQSREADVRVSVTVQAGNPVNHEGTVYQPGQTFTLHKYRADALVAQGRVVINP
jgi:hypothetical protein